MEKTPKKSRAPLLDLSKVNYLAESILNPIKLSNRDERPRE